jgi:prepilin-type N-terminal cleavage/methylation domain-containing protein
MHTRYPCAPRATAIARRSGFTLIEILCVVIILGIAGAVIVPQIGTRDDLRAASAARALMADLIYAQNLAITSQGNHYVAFDVANRRYTVLNSSLSVVQHPVEKGDFIMTFGAGGSPGLRECSLSSAGFLGTSSSDLRTTIGFDELGTPLVRFGGTDETLTSGEVKVRSGNYELTIRIEPYTGQITVLTP